MYSGHDIIFAWYLSISDVSDIFDIEYDEDDPFNSQLEVNNILTDHQLVFEMFYLPCCYFTENEVFIGVHLGGISAQYRNEIIKHDSMTKYLDKYNRMISKTERRYEKMQHQINEDVETLFKEFPKFSNYKTQSDISFYTIPNDCENCS